MAFTEVQLANMAMARIGHTIQLDTAGSTIAGLDPALSLENQQAYLFYTNCLEHVLRDFPWNFALLVGELNLEAIDDGTQVWSGRWKYEYRYPETALLIRAVRFPGELRDHPLPNDFEVSSDATGRLVRTNVGVDEDGGAVVDFTYTPKVVVYSDDSTFVTAFTSYLGFEMAPGLLVDPSKAQAAFQVYRMALLAAQRSNANEDQWGEGPDGSFVTLHRSG